ncbi:MAG: phosphate ABC transporter substrate-binding protein PstS [Chloroflexi bacterium]|nr:phosphate ABC transporter substrate-binding protein PstS [Chloroflexota bacterium]
MTVMTRRRLLLALASSSVLLAACGGSSTGSTSASASAATSSVTSTSPSSSSSTSTLGSSTAAPSIATGNPTKSVTLLESGSSLLYPLMNLWAPEIHKKYSNISLQPQSTGSGTGISQASAGAVQIGASDAYMSDAQVKRVQGGILNIPVAISAQQINYNLPGVSGHLNIDGPALAGIYTGKVQYWDDAAIAGQNSGVKLPHEKIVPVHRTDGSGDTFIFTQYLSDTDGAWKSAVGFGTSVSWPPVQGALGANGNAGVVQTLAQTKYSIGYVGISFLDEATKQGLGEAMLKNQAGKYLLPDNGTISAAAAQLAPKTPDDMRISLIFAPGDTSYPIINYEYLLIKPQQPDANTALAIRTLLTWGLSPTDGSASQFLSQVHFIALPSDIRTKSLKLVAEIQ